MIHSLRSSVALLSAVGLLACSGEATDGELLGQDGEAIQNGTPVTTDTWGSPSWGCSSTLLRDRWLMTAKHCGPSAGVSVRLLNNQTTTFQTVFNHPTSDVSIVRLAGPLVPSGSAASRGPWPLYKGSEAQLLNKTLYCQAWGGPSGQLLSGNLTVNVVGTGVPGFCDGSARCFQTVATGTQEIEGGDSGGGCMLTSSFGGRNRVAGAIAGGTADLNFHESVPWFRDWANGIIGTAPTFGTLTGYERADLFSTVLYVNGSNHLIELALGFGGWSRADLTTFIGAVDASSNPAAFVRWDGVSSVAFRSSDGHIRELALEHGGTWSKRDISAETGAPAATGNPASYGRADRYGIVLYRTSTGDVIELSLAPGSTSWAANNLTQIFGLPAAAADPVGYVRADGRSAVVFRENNGHIRELSIPIGGGWSHADITPSGAPTAKGQPRPYTRSDGVSAVVYRDNSNLVHELERPFGASAWTVSDITHVTTSISDPFGYVRADGKSVVLFKGTDFHILEYTSTGTSWTKTDLTATTPGALNATGTGLSAYVRADLLSAVVYRTSDNHIQQFQRPIASPSWVHVDLTQQVGGAI